MIRGKEVERAYSGHHTKDSCAEGCCIYLLLFSLVNATISKQSTLAPRSRHIFPFNGWRREGESRKKKKKKKRVKVGSDCFSKIKVQEGNQTPQTQSRCCQLHKCCFWYLMLSIILCMYSLKDKTLLHVCVYFSSSICLK